jgi:hypothetical protein
MFILTKDAQIDAGFTHGINVMIHLAAAVAPTPGPVPRLPEAVATCAGKTAPRTVF